MDSNAIPTTNNEAWGLYGTIRHAAAASAVWPIAITAVADATGCVADEVREFLDSRHGRNFADDVASQVFAGKPLA